MALGRQSCHCTSAVAESTVHLPTNERSMPITCSAPFPDQVSQGKIILYVFGVYFRDRRDCDARRPSSLAAVVLRHVFWPKRSLTAALTLQTIDKSGFILHVNIQIESQLPRVTGRDRMRYYPRLTPGLCLCSLTCRARP